MRYFFIIALLLCLDISAQEKKFTYYTTADGLPGNWVYICKEDAKGFLWIALESGLARFDGNNFVTYDKRNGMPDVEVLDLAFDKENKVWLNVFRFEPSYFDPVLNRVINAKENKQFAGYLGAIINIKSLQDGSIGYASNIVKIFRKQNEAPVVFNLKQSGSTILEKENNLIIANPFLFTKLDQTRIVDSIKIVQSKLDAATLIKTTSDSCYYSNGLTDSLFLFTNINFTTHSYTSKAVKLAEPLSQLTIGRNYLWMIAKSGNIYMLNKQTLEIINKLPIQVKANSVYEDSKGNFWICSTDKGLIKVSAPLAQSLAIPNEFTDRNFISICRYKGKIFAGNYNSNIIETDGRFFLAHKTSSGSGNWIRQLLPSTQGLVSISEMGIFINMINTFSNDNNRFLASKNGLLLNDSILLYSGWNSFDQLNMITKKRTTLINNKRSNGIAVVNNQVYFGSTDGLYKIIRKDSVFHVAKKNELLSNRVTTLFNNKDDLLWMGTASNGLMVVYKDSLVINITNKNLLQSDAVRFIHAEKPGTVWVATNKGISGIDYTFTNNTFQYSIRNIGVADGLLAPQVNALWVENDTVYAATTNGINYFPASITPPQNKLEVYITGFSVNGRDTALISSQSFPHHFKNIVLHFAAPEINGSSVSYQYNINNAGWQNNNNGLLELPQLKPGHYYIDFRAIDANGKPSSLISNFKFTIHPAWWQTGWFIALATIAIAGLLFYWLQKRNHRKREKALEQLATKQKLTDLELQAVKAQINPHFVFNCLNSIKSLIHQQQYEDADKYLDDFSYLLRSTIDHSSQKMITLEEELKYIHNYLRLEQLRFGKKLTYKINSAVTDKKKLLIPSMLLQPYVENAIKHGIRNLADGTGFVHIDFTETPDTLTCRIDDNGVGLEAAAQINAGNPHYHQSVGLSLTGKREELFGIRSHTIDKKNNQGKGTGTTVVLEIPLHYI